MTYRYKDRIRFSEVDETLHLSLFSILTAFQDCSIFHSSSLGMGIPELRAEGHVWLLSSWQVVIDRYPALCEEVELATWAYGWHNFFGYRNFTMTDAENRLAVRANTSWVYTDIRTRHPARIPQEVADAYSTEPMLEMDVAGRRIPLPPDGREREPIPVEPPDLDANLHVNNARYVQIAQGFLPEGFVTREVRAEYKTAAHGKDIFYPRVSEGDGVFTIALNNANGRPFAIVEFIGGD